MWLGEGKTVYKAVQLPAAAELSNNETKWLDKYDPNLALSY